MSMLVATMSRSVSHLVNSVAGMCVAVALVLVVAVFLRLRDTPGVHHRIGDPLERKLVSRPRGSSDSIV